MSPLGHWLTAAAAAAVAYRVGTNEDIGLAVPRLIRWIVTGGMEAAPASGVALLFSLGMVLGARGPDRLEIPIWNAITKTRQSLIPHRTLTHWPWPWLALCAACLGRLDREAGFKQALLAVGGGFSAAGILHLVLDWMTPTGIPFVHPFGPRSSLNVYRSGSAGEWVCTLLACAAMAGFAFFPMSGK